MAINEKSDLNAAAELYVTGKYAANVLLSQIGIRAVPHWPCGFQCEATNSFAEQLDSPSSVLQEPPTAAIIREILSWPAEWSALHGIAEVKTPVLKICGAVKYTASPLSVKWVGTNYPKEGARGLGFPYRHSPPQQVLTVLR